jgi:hypothetical protein
VSSSQPLYYEREDTRATSYKGIFTQFQKHINQPRPQLVQKKTVATIPFSIPCDPNGLSTLEIRNRMGFPLLERVLQTLLENTHIMIVLYRPRNLGNMLIMSNRQRVTLPLDNGTPLRPQNPKTLPPETS